MLNSYSTLVWWTVLILISTLAGISCSPEGDVENTGPILTTESFVLKPESKFNITTYYYNTPVPCEFPCGYLPCPEGSIDSDRIDCDRSTPIIEPDTIPIPPPLTREYLEYWINDGFIRHIALENEISFPTLEEFPLDIPGAPINISECSSGFLDNDTFTILCKGNNNDPSEKLIGMDYIGVYSTAIVILTVDIFNQRGNGILIFSIMSEYTDWSSVQTCEFSFYSSPIRSKPSLWCLEPRIGSLNESKKLLSQEEDAWSRQ